MQQGRLSLFREALEKPPRAEIWPSGSLIPTEIAEVSGGRISLLFPCIHAAAHCI